MKEHTNDNMHASVKTENGMTYIDGVPALRWGQWTECTFSGSVTALLNTMEIPATYTDIMGVSASCYRMAMSTWGNWDPGSTLLQVNFGYVPDTNAGKAFGVEPYCLSDADERDRQVMCSIDQGIPVLICGGRCAPEWGLVVGYEKTAQGTKFFGRSYFDVEGAPKEEIYTDNGYLLQNKYPGESPEGLMWFFDRKCPPLSPLAALKESLDSCIMQWECDTRQDYMYYNKKAYAEFIRGFTLEQNDSFDEFVSYHLRTLIDARRCASLYLDKQAALLCGVQQEKLLQVAMLYKEMADKLTAIIPYEKLYLDFSPSMLTKEVKAQYIAALNDNIELEENVHRLVKCVLENWTV